MSHWSSARAGRVLAALLRIGWATKRQTGSHRVLTRPGWNDFVFAFHEGEEIGPRMLTRIGVTSRLTERAAHTRAVKQRADAAVVLGTLLAMNGTERLRTPGRRCSGPDRAVWAVTTISTRWRARHERGPDDARRDRGPDLEGLTVMAFPSLEQSLNKVSNRYMLVVVASKRARQINRGAAARVVSKHNKPTSVALEEIAAAKVEYRVKVEGETAKV